MLGVLVIPLWLKAVLKVGSEGVETLNIAYVDIFVKLLLSFFVPAVLGKVGALGCDYITLHCLPTAATRTVAVHPLPTRVSS